MMAGETAIECEQGLWVAYLVDQILTTRSFFDKKKFCKALLYGDNKVEELFHKYKQGRPVLECIAYMLSHHVSNWDAEDFIRFVNDTLRKCDLQAHIITDAQLKELPVLQGTLDCECFLNPEEKSRIFNEIFTTISTRHTDLERVLAHFLVNYHEWHTIKMNFPHDVRERVLEVLKTWYESNDPVQITWGYLKKLLLYFGANLTVECIDQDLFGVNSVSQPMPYNPESYVFGTPGIAQTGVFRTKPGVLSYSTFRDIYENLDLSKIELPEKIDVVTSGKLCTTPLTFVDYTDRCKRFFADYFSIHFYDDMLNENIRFPPGYMCKIKIYDVAAKFELPNTVLITDYNLVEHCEMLRLDLNDIFDKLQIEPTSMGEGDKHFLVLDYIKQCIFIIHYSEAESEEGALKDLEAGDNYCRLFFNVFSLLLGTNGTNLSYVSVVAAPKIESCCENLLIFNRDDLFESDLSQKLIDLYSYIDEITPADVSNEIHQPVILAVSYIFSFLAITKIGPEFLFGTVTEKILLMWLTKEQMKVVFCEKFWRIVTGGYGTGKSVVTRYLLKCLVKNAIEPVDIYFVLFDNDSLFLKSLESFFKKIMDTGLKDDHLSKANVIFGNCEEIEKCLLKEFEQIGGSGRKDIHFTVSNMLLAMAMKARSTKRRFHLIVDELDGEVINSVEALALKEIFKQYRDSLIDSHILFSIRSMEKRRTNVIGKERIEHNSFQCYKDCGMKVMLLSLSMRTTKQVSKIIQISTEGITRPNRFLQPLQTTLPQNPTDQIANSSSTTSVDFSEINEVISHCITENVGVAVDDIKAISEPDQIVFDVHSGGIHLKISCKPNPNFPLTSESEETVSHRLDAERLLYNELQVHHSNPDNIVISGQELEERFQGSNTAIETDYIFQQCTDWGHNIYGRQPILVFLNQYEKEDLTNKEKLTLLSIALQRHCYNAERRNEKRMIICNEESEYEICMSALTGLGRKYVLYIPGASDYQSFDEKSLESKTVITGYEGCRGMECSQVVVIVNPKEHFKRQFFIEMVSRSTDHLVLIVPYAYDEINYGANEREFAGHIVKKLCYQSRQEDLTAAAKHSESSGKNVLDIFSYVITEDQDKQYPHAVSSYCQKSKVTTIKINTNHSHHQKYSQIALLTEVPSKPKPKENATLSFMQPEPVKDLRGRLLSENSIELSWLHVGNSFQIAKTTLSEDTAETPEEYEIIHPHFHGNKLQLNVEKQLRYKFEILAISKYGGLLSAPAEIGYPWSGIESKPSDTPIRTASSAAISAPASKYTFGGLLDFIAENKVSSFQRILSTDPHIVKVRGLVGETLLMVASLYKKPSFVPMLVQHGSDVEETSFDGSTCLHYCATGNSVDCLSILLPIVSPDIINLQNNDKHTALLVASRCGSLECIELLLKHNADPHIQDKFGRIAYDVACRNYEGRHEKNRRIKEVLLQHQKGKP